MSRRTPALLVALALGLGPALASCGDEEPASSSAGSIPGSEPFNDADVTFAADMIPHHAQALLMVDLTRGEDLSPEVTALAEQIQAAQAPEIEQMTDWLEAWDQPVPETPRDHANAEEHGSEDSGMSLDLHALESAHGEEFERAWLEAMIEHHRGAVEMAEQEVADGEDADAVALAKDIAAAQQQEIDQMERLLG